MRVVRDKFQSMLCALRRFANICVFALGWGHSCCRTSSPQHECKVQDKSSSKENTISGQEKLFIGYSTSFMVCIVALLLPGFVWNPGAEWMAPINAIRTNLLVFIAAVCAFLIIISKNIADGPTQPTTELVLGLDVSLAGFSAAFLSIQEDILASQMASIAREYRIILMAVLFVLAAPVLCSLCLWIRRLYLCRRDSVAIKIYVRIFICMFVIIGLLVAWGIVATIVHRLFPDLDVVGILAIPTAILFVPIAIVLFICCAYIRRH